MCFQQPCYASLACVRKLVYETASFFLFPLILSKLRLLKNDNFNFITCHKKTSLRQLYNVIIQKALFISLLYN